MNGEGVVLLLRKQFGLPNPHSWLGDNYAESRIRSKWDRWSSDGHNMSWRSGVG